MPNKKSLIRSKKRNKKRSRKQSLKRRSRKQSLKKRKSKSYNPYAIIGLGTTAYALFLGGLYYGINKGKKKFINEKDYIDFKKCYEDTSKKDNKDCIKIIDEMKKNYNIESFMKIYNGIVIENQVNIKDYKKGFEGLSTLLNTVLIVVNKKYDKEINSETNKQKVHISKKILDAYYELLNIKNNYEKIQELVDDKNKFGITNKIKFFE